MLKNYLVYLRIALQRADIEDRLFAVLFSKDMISPKSKKRNLCSKATPKPKKHKIDKSILKNDEEIQHEFDDNIKNAINEIAFQVNHQLNIGVDSKNKPILMKARKCLCFNEYNKV